MTALQTLVFLWIALGGIGLVWWAERVMNQLNDELSDFAQHADLRLGSPIGGRTTSGTPAAPNASAWTP